MSASKNNQILEFKNLVLSYIREKDVGEFSDFVFRLYRRHYRKKYGWEPSEEEYYGMKEEDIKRFFQSTCFAFKNNLNQIVGTIKVTYKLPADVFPIEDEFGIDLDTIINERGLKVNHIWHLGRLAIDSALLKKEKDIIPSTLLIRELIRQTFMIVNRNKNGLIVAESDALIYTIFRELGINMQKIGPVQDCLGSPTYPVIITGEDVKSWLRNIDDINSDTLYMIK
ncbi:hypothetical protein M0D21_13900 [Aquimarina sp. D1M17]|uniref:hypothetical protein n=1 Tax=Aquimarina acroporae TaxID=2937283 RepID=UPI0020C0C7ED|nr:hypothetical protein [Aquimarina acroporae]MCK8522673.1 hypothetical protein [Aquimarina acroporae]